MNWEPILEELNRFLVTDADLDYIVSDYPTGWLGSEPATPESVQEVERRLHIGLPPSYRSFLLFTNGWGPIDASVTRLLATQELGWLSEKSPQIAALVAGLSGGPLSHTGEKLQISETGESLILLDPSTVGQDGEWEASYVAPWSPSVTKFGSFGELMQEQLVKAKE